MLNNFKLFSVLKIIRNYYVLEVFFKKTSELMEQALVRLGISQLAFTCPKATIETIEDVKYVQS